MSDLVWECRLAGTIKPIGRCTTRQAAMNLADKPWRSGLYVVQNTRTGEEWERRGGSWNCALQCWPSKEDVG